MSFIKKTASALLCAVLVASSVLVFAACGKNNNNNTENSTTKSNNANVTVRYLNFKPEVADVYKKIADEYEKETGVKVIVETAANNEYESTLTAKMSTFLILPRVIEFMILIQLHLSVTQVLYVKWSLMIKS